MQLIRDISSFRAERRKILSPISIGFVPTMGALHEGHASLAKRSVQENDLTIASIFVNPTQFGPNEDLDKYPRTLESDAALLESIGVDILLAPTKDQVYPKDGSSFFIQINNLANKLCGASRETHFNGVVQIVSILFNIVQPTRAYFGQKDYQQCLIIQQMVKEFFFPVEVVPCPIVREKDGLAMSSRNRYLTPDERKQAVVLSQILSHIKAHKGDFESVEAVYEYAKQKLQDAPLLKLDYFDVLNGQDLEAAQSLSREEDPVAFIAAYAGKARLIDNMKLYE